MVMTGSSAVSRQMLQSKTSLELEGFPPDGCRLWRPVHAGVASVWHAMDSSADELTASTDIGPTGSEVTAAVGSLGSLEGQEGRQRGRESVGGTP